MKNQQMSDCIEHNLEQRERAHEALNSALDHALTHGKQGAVGVRIPVVAKNGCDARLGTVRVIYEVEY